MFRLTGEFWNRLDCDDASFCATEKDLQESLDLAQTFGWLQAAEPAVSAVCGECGGVHEVAFLTATSTSIRKCCYLVCPHGPAPFDPEILLRWRVNTFELLKSVSLALVCRGPAVSLSDHVWSLGRLAVGYSREVMFVRGWPQNRSGAIDKLKTHPKAILLTCTSISREKWVNTVPNPIFSLEELCTTRCSPTALLIDHAFLEGELVTKSKAAPRSPRRRDSREAAIGSLQQCLVEELRALKCSLQFHRDQGTEPDWHPPQQKMLARQAGLSEYNVSRCLNDKSAHYLKLLWSIRADPEQILNWSKPSLGRGD